MISTIITLACPFLFSVVTVTSEVSDTIVNVTDEPWRKYFAFPLKFDQFVLYIIGPDRQKFES